MNFFFKTEFFLKKALEFRSILLGNCPHVLKGIMDPKLVFIYNNNILRQ